MHFVGNVMIDTLFRYREQARESAILADLGLTPGTYAALTLHRPSNVDDARRPRAHAGGDRAHPGGDPGGLPGAPSHAARVSRRSTAGCRPRAGLRLVEPLPYLDFVQLMANARCVLTDSGGIQEETTALGVPVPHAAGEHRAADHRDAGHQPHRGRGPGRDLRGLARMSPQAGGPRASFPSSGTARRPSASSVCSSRDRRPLAHRRLLNGDPRAGRRDRGVGRVRPSKRPRQPVPSARLEARGGGRPSVTGPTTSWPCAAAGSKGVLPLFEVRGPARRSRAGLGALRGVRRHLRGRGRRAGGPPRRGDGACAPRGRRLRGAAPPGRAGDRRCPPSRST